MALELLLTDEAVCLDKPPADPSAKVVKCNTPEAAFQLVGKGAPISADDAARFGVKTKKAEETNFTLRMDSHTIARTPEEKAYAMTQPQPGLVAARAEQIRSAANLAVASLVREDQAKATEATAEAKKAEEGENKKLKAKLANKTAKAPRKARVKKAAAAKTEETKKTEEK